MVPPSWLEKQQKFGNWELMNPSIHPGIFIVLYPKERILIIELRSTVELIFKVRQLNASIKLV